MPVQTEHNETVSSAPSANERVASPLVHLWRRVAANDAGILLILALSVVLLHIAVNGRYGFHRDELLTYTNAQHLAWGYVPYPPVTPFLARIDLELFGTSLRGFRMAAAFAHGLLVLLTGLAARELGGRREAQFLAAFGAIMTGGALVHGSFLSYSTFDFPCWILVAYFVIRLLKSDDPRWCVAIGAAIALGMMAKYSMAFLVIGVLGGLLLTPARRYLKSWWLWCGVALALLLMLPNIVWQVHHHFVTLAYLKSIHARDIRWGWTDYFLPHQLRNPNPVMVPIWLAGLWYLFGTTGGRRYRMLGWMYVIPLLAFLLAKGRDYYLAPAYSMLMAAGAVCGEHWVNSLSAGSARVARRITWQVLLVATLYTIAITLPIAPLGSSWWRLANGANGGNFDMQIGWQEYVEQIAKVRDSLPADERAAVGVLTYDEGETGAVNMYGRAYGLPRAISGMNSNWYRGYGDPAPQAVIVIGADRDLWERSFTSCVLAGHATNRYGIKNSSVANWNEILVCRQPRAPWPDFWRHFQYYG